ncbi:MAG: phosphate--AMP phosphotransferase, partial [Cetobacterium sp.]
ITEEDWRNREKWKDYNSAIEDMISRTSTTVAPWHIVPANDKYYARIFVLKRFIDAIEKRLYGKK